MRSVLKICSCLLALGFALGPRHALAQDSQESAPTADNNGDPILKQNESAATATPSLLRDAADQSNAPDVYLLPDATGQLRRVLGFRYEDFLEAWQRMRGPPLLAPPRYVLDAWEVSGQLTETHARLRIEFSLTTQAAGWIDIPLQLPDFIVQSVQIDAQAIGESLAYDAKRQGHLLWLAGKAGTKRTIVLEGFAKLQQSASNQALALHLPRATTAQFSVRVPDTLTRFSADAETELLMEKLPDGSTEVRVLGQANPLRLEWSRTEAEAPQQPSLMEVESQTTVSLDRRRLAYDATLEIVSLSRPVRQIQVRLPPGAWLSRNASASDDEIMDISSGTSQDQSQTVTIRRKSPSERPWELHLTAEKSIQPGENAQEVTLEGFEVLDAFRQSGTVRLEVDEQLQAYFDSTGDIQQTPTKISRATDRSHSVLGSFRFTSFPWQLLVNTSPRARRVSVQPSYKMVLGAEETQLDAQYLYELTGAQIFSLRIDLGGWKLRGTPIESGGVIDLDGVVETRDGRLVLPLLDTEAQQLRLNLSLRKASQIGQNNFSLPEPLGALVVDGELDVSSSKALQVAPQLNEMTGLSLISADLDSGSGATERDLERDKDQIKMRTFLAKPTFVAELRERPPVVLAEQKTLVEIGQQTVQVRQQIDFQAKYRPVSQLSVLAPESLGTNETFRITMAGEPLSFAMEDLQGDVSQAENSRGDSNKPDAVDENNPAASNSSLGAAPLKTATITLPRPMLNDIPLEVAYELPAPGLAAEESTPLRLPLVAPTQTLSKHELVVEAEPPVVVALNQRSGADAWQVVSDTDAGERSASTLQLRTETRASHVSLFAQLDSSGRLPLATLERGWIQSWITHSQRQERVVFRFRTSHEQTYVRFPSGFEPTNVEVLLDGVAWRHEFLADNRLLITLPAEKVQESHTLELRYQASATLPSLGSLRTQLPRLECRETSAPIYWQVVLPRGWLLASSPEELIPDYWLGWKNFRWGRQPTLSQADLEQITTASSAPEPSPMSVSYVYRAFEMPTEIEVVVVRRAWVFVLGSLLIFGCGLCWNYTSLLRRGAVWLGISLILMAGVFSYPEVTVLAIQVLLAGGAMTIATSILRGIFSVDSGPRAVPTAQLDMSTQLNRFGPIPESVPFTKPETTASMKTGGPTR